MVIEPHILIPSAAAAVFVMIMFIRLIAGPRNVILSEADIVEFLANEETGIMISDLIISADKKYALVHLDDKSPLRLIRSFGDKIVMQVLSAEDLKEDENSITIKRQDISHSALSFKFPEKNLSENWHKILFAPNSLEANP